ncbi:glutathione S-transferase family protein [Acinetobacter defluvii]|uniref:glutathione S-transferase family protein n=1 Tax=Acinetobacter defluvii TaxID=1871111 RepID=UPI003AF50276
MKKSKRILYQFPLSLYCEKTRWNLDFKGLDYSCKNLLPGLHVFSAWAIAQQRSLPILRDNQQVIGDSTNIALYLENLYPQLPLIPSELAIQKQVLKYEQYFDELGDHVRRLCWSMVIDQPEIVEIFFNFTGYSPFQRFITHYSESILRLMIRKTFQIYQPQVINSNQKVTDALDLLEQHLNGNEKNYLVNNQFSLADLTAASMLAPLIGPENSPWADSRLPEVASQQRQELRDRIVGQWVLRIYHNYRSFNGTDIKQ